MRNIGKGEGGQGMETRVDPRSPLKVLVHGPIPSPQASPLTCPQRLCTTCSATAVRRARSPPWRVVIGRGPRLACHDLCSPVEKMAVLAKDGDCWLGAGAGAGTALVLLPLPGRENTDSSS